MTLDNSRKAILGKLPGTIVALCAQTGLSRSTVSRSVARMHDARLCYIAKWVQSAAGKNAPCLAVYGAGYHKDAPYPRTARKIKTLDKAIFDGTARARKKAIADADRVSKVRDPMLWCLFDVRVTF